MSSNRPTAKRSPSILVTDVRNKPSGGVSAPFAGASGRRTADKSRMPPSQPQKQPSASTSSSSSNTNSGINRPGASLNPNVIHGPTSGSKFDNISIDNILSHMSDIPSAQKRSPPDNRYYEGSAGRRGHPGGLGINTASVDFAGKSIGSAGRRSGPPRLMQAIFPQRTTKLSEKLVLIPEDIDPGFRFIDDGDDLSASPPKLGAEEDIDASSAGPKRSYAERLPKDKRAEKFSRVTAYCTADGYRLQATAEFLRTQHMIRPRIYDEALYAPYYLPLLAGDDSCRVRSSPGGGSLLMERLIDRSEQGDHHYEYYSGLDSTRQDISGDTETGNSNQQHEDSWNEDDDFDPSEPQSFSPPTNSQEFLANRSNKRHNDYREPHEQVSLLSQYDPQPQAPNEPQEPQVRRRPPQKALTLESPDLTKHAEVFIFSYGVIVFWNFTERQEKDLLADLTFARVETDGGTKSLIVRPINDIDIETEELHFSYAASAVKPRIYNDMITLRSGDHMIKLAMSHAIAQSTKLSRFEARMDINMHDVKHVPKMLALTGHLGMKREDVLKISGKLFKLRVDVNLSSNVLDTPDFFWEAEPSLNPLYSAVKEYLEIEPRILVLNERCKVFLELTDIIADSIAEGNMSRITWIIIILIMVSLAVSTLEIAMRFLILHKGIRVIGKE